MLRRNVDGTTSIAAVLDWEWAHRGSQLSDLATLLRRIPEEDPLVHGLITTIEDAGGFVGPGNAHEFVARIQPHDPVRTSSGG